MAASEALTTEEPFIPEDTFAVRLVIIRNALHLTQKEAAERCGLDDGSWSNWENGSKPRDMARVIESICSNLGVDRDWLMWGGPLAQNLKFLTPLTVLDGPVGQGSLLGDDLSPLDFYSRPELASV